MLSVAYVTLVVLMIVGAFKERRVFLLPWLIFQLLDAVLNLIPIIYMAVVFETMLLLLIVKVPVTLAFWAVVLAYYVQLRPYSSTAEKQEVINC